MDIARDDALPVRASVLDRIKARAPTYWRYFLEDPFWILMFLFARTLAGRRIERWLSRAGHRRPVAAVQSMFSDVDVETIVSELITDGISVGLKLPIDVVEEVRTFAERTPCFSRDRQDAGFLPHDVAQANLARERDVLTGYYFEAVETSPAIRRLAQDSALISIATAYVGCAPLLIRTRLWWSFPARRVLDTDLHAVAQERFHFDMNGWRTQKFFFYLTATDADSGAHKCILGSHRRRRLKHQLTLTVGRSEEELVAYYGKDRFFTVTGDAGTGFAEDPFVFHTGSLCRDNRRLLLELEYGPAPVSPSYRYGRLG